MLRFFYQRHYKDLESTTKKQSRLFQMETTGALQQTANVLTHAQYGFLGGCHIWIFSLAALFLLGICFFLFFILSYNNLSLL
jgi:hypothetical protein